MKKLGLSLLVLLIFVSLLATACGAKETETPTPVPTQRPTSTERPTPTLRPSPTIPPTPTEVPLPTPIPVGGEWELIQVHEDEDDLVTIETVNQTISVAWGILQSADTGAKIDVWCMHTNCRVEKGMIYAFNGALFSPCEEENKQVFSNFSVLEE